MNMYVDMNAQIATLIELHQRLKAVRSRINPADLIFMKSTRKLNLWIENNCYLCWWVSIIQLD